MPKEKIPFLGALEDNRSEAEKAKDFRYEELVAETPIFEWKEIPQSDWRKYPVRDQNGSSGCVSFSTSLELGILNEIEEKEFVLLSPRSIYARRVNKGTPGMFAYDANNIAIKYGATLEYLLPSDGKNEEQMNDLSDLTKSKELIGQIYRAKSWIALPFNFDVIASVIEKTKKGVKVWFRFASGEWNREIPIITNQKPIYIHSVVAIDYTLYQGKKALIIQDSWGKTNTIEGRRIITEDWIPRMVWASYFEDLENFNVFKQEDMEKPKHKFLKDLYPGMKDDEVKYLQDALKWIGVFPRTQESTGVFGGITRQAVKTFQTMYNIVPVSGIVGPKTREVLNKIFA